MSGAWRIAGWDRFENSRSRGVRYCQFVAVPLVLDDVRYARLMRQPDGPACFGVFIALVQWHMRFGGEVRSGWLTHDGTEYGEPLTVDDIAAYLKMDDVTVSVALDVLGSPAVGWMQGPCGAGAEPVLDCVLKSALPDKGSGRVEDGMFESVVPQRFDRGFTEPVRSCGRDSVLTRAVWTEDRGLRTEKEGEVVGVSRGRVRGGPTTTPPPAEAGEAGKDEGGRMRDEAGRATTPPPAEAGDGEPKEEEEEWDGERSAPGSGGIGKGCERETPQAPRVGQARWSPEAAAMVEIPCRDGAFCVPVESLRRYVSAYPDVDVTAQLLRMQDWAYSKIESGGLEALKAWICEVAPAGVTGWLADEQKKAEARAKGFPAGGVGSRGAAGPGRAGWRGEIEALDKQKRAVHAQIETICEKYKFYDDHEGAERRKRFPNAWCKVRSLRGDVERINAAISNVRREG